MSDKVLDLLLFLKDKETSVNNDGSIVIWINFFDLNEFQELFSKTSLFVDDGGYECNLQEGCIAIDIRDLIECCFKDEEVKYIRKKLKEWE